MSTPPRAVYDVVTLIDTIKAKFRRISTIYPATSNNEGQTMVDAENHPASSAEGLPRAFHDVGKHISTVYEILKAIEDHISQRKDDKNCAKIQAIAEECDSKADCFQRLFSKVVLSDKKGECYRMASREIGNNSRVEDLMRDVMKDVKLLLTADGEMQNATESQLRSLEQAMEEVSKIPRSLPDESPGLGINNYGWGFQNVNTGSGPQNNNNDKGIQVNGGTFHNVNPFHPQ